MKEIVSNRGYRSITRTTNNAGEKAKFHIYYFIGKDGTDAVTVEKLTLAKNYRKGFQLIRIFKGQYVYRELMVFKSDTLKELSNSIEKLKLSL